MIYIIKKKETIKIKQQAIVKSIKGDRLEVFVVRSSGCGDCSSCGACEAKIVKLNFENKINANKGDLIELEYKTRAMVKYSALMYLFPLGMLIIGIVLGYIFIDSSNLKDIFSFLLGLILMILAYLIIHVIDKNFKEDSLIKIKKLDWGDLAYGNTK